MTTRNPALTTARSLKVPLGIFLVLVLSGLSVFLALGGRTGIAARPGLFGTRANLFSDLSLVAQVIFLAGLVVGTVFARKGHISTHQYIQTGLVFFNIVVTLFIMVVAFGENVIPGMPGNLQQASSLVPAIHGGIGLLAISCGIYLILRMNRLLPLRWRISWWKNLMRFTLALYWVVGVMGLVTYYLWYVR